MFEQFHINTVVVIIICFDFFCRIVLKTFTVSTNKLIQYFTECARTSELPDNKAVCRVVRIIRDVEKL